MRALWAEDDGSAIGYMCAIDWQYEISGASGGTRVYPSIDDLKEHHPCWEGCGIVEVRVTFSKVIVEEREP